VSRFKGRKTKHKQVIQSETQMSGLALLFVVTYVLKAIFNSYEPCPHNHFQTFLSYLCRDSFVFLCFYKYSIRPCSAFTPPLCRHHQFPWQSFLFHSTFCAKVFSIFHFHFLFYRLIVSHNFSFGQRQGTKKHFFIILLFFAYTSYYYFSFFTPTHK